jgi:hypothetical protein
MAPMLKDWLVLKSAQKLSSSKSLTQIAEQDQYVFGRSLGANVGTPYAGFAKQYILMSEMGKSAPWGRAASQNKAACMCVRSLPLLDTLLGHSLGEPRPPGFHLSFPSAGPSCYLPGSKAINACLEHFQNIN